MAETRDDFHEPEKRLLANRAGNICSQCHAQTSGPTKDPRDWVNVGIAAHITAAAPDGPRYDDTLSSLDRRSADNGIWLCTKCAKIIDDDQQRFTVQLLRKMKAEAEELARLLIDSPRVVEFKGQPAEIQMIVAKWDETVPEGKYGDPPQMVDYNFRILAMKNLPEVPDGFFPSTFAGTAIGPNHSLIAIDAQNVGTVKAQHARIRLRLQNPMARIRDVIATDARTVLSGGARSSYVDAYLEHLFPRTRMGLHIYIPRKAEFAVGIDVENGGGAEKIIVCEVTIGNVLRGEDADRRSRELGGGKEAHGS